MYIFHLPILLQWEYNYRYVYVLIAVSETVNSLKVSPTVRV